MAQKQAHRGRIQAQGSGLEASETWQQAEPLSKKDGLRLLDKLLNKLPKKEQAIRDQSFKDAQRFIEQVEGGLDAPVRKTFRNRKTKDVRVDVEVWSGIAFISFILMILLVWYLI